MAITQRNGKDVDCIKLRFCAGMAKRSDWPTLDTVKRAGLVSVGTADQVSTERLALAFI